MGWWVGGWEEGRTLVGEPGTAEVLAVLDATHGLGEGTGLHAVFWVCVGWVGGEPRASLLPCRRKHTIRRVQRAVACPTHPHHPATATHTHQPCEAACAYTQRPSSSSCPQCHCCSSWADPPSHTLPPLPPIQSTCTHLPSHLAAEGGANHDWRDVGCCVVRCQGEERG